MTVLIQSSYIMPVADQPLTHARIAHANNWLSGGTAAASSTDAAFFSNGPLNSLTYERWKPNGTSSETWEYNHGSSATCDYCAIGAHTIGTSGATVAVQYYDGAIWQTLIAAQTVPDNSAIYCVFAPVEAQRWRILVNGAAPTVGVVKFGLALQMQQAIYGGHMPFSFARQTVTRSNVSGTGELLGRTVQRRSAENSFEWQHLKAWWVEANWPSLQKAVESEPFFIAWRPSHKQDVAFGQTDQVPMPTNMGISNLMSVAISVRGYLGD